VIIVHAPHWITMVGHHVNCVPNPRGRSVEPIFPHLLRYRYDFQTDVDLAEAIVDEADAAGLVASRMTDPGVRVDYATIGALHLLNPDWDIPVVSLSANNNPYYAEAGLDDMEVLGAATRRAVERTGRRAVLAASNSLSHLHWDTEPDLPEDMARSTVQPPPVPVGHAAAGARPRRQDPRAARVHPGAHRADGRGDQGRQPVVDAGGDGLARDPRGRAGLLDGHRHGQRGDRMGPGPSWLTRRS
jgi:Catalytic LigB subunit of aromatic ring-opening dioxygenase